MRQRRTDEQSEREHTLRESTHRWPPNLGVNCRFSDLQTELRQTLLLSCSTVKRRLDRSLVASLPINLVSPGSMYGERLSQLDLRLARTVRLGRKKTTFQFDRYNALNVV